MTTPVRPRRYTLRWKASRDWPLAGAVISAVLSFAMLFPPWLSSQAGSEDAFGPHMQAAGPALIIVTVLAIIIFVAIAMTMTDRRYLMAASVAALTLLIIYVIKVADVSDLADLYSQIAAISLATDVHISTGAGVWAGFIFSLLTLLFLLLALGLKWGTGETLRYPISINATAHEPGHHDAPSMNSSQSTSSSNHPSPPEDSSHSPQERPSE